MSERWAADHVATPAMARAMSSSSSQGSAASWPLMARSQRAQAQSTSRQCPGALPPGRLQHQWPALVPDAVRLDMA